MGTVLLIAKLPKESIQLLCFAQQVTQSNRSLLKLLHGMINEYHKSIVRKDTKFILTYIWEQAQRDT